MQNRDIIIASMLVFAVLIAVTQAKAVRPVDQLANCEKTDKNGRHMLGAGCQNSATGPQTKGASKPVSGRHLLEELDLAHVITGYAAALIPGRKLLAADAAAAAAATQKKSKKMDDEEEEEEEEDYEEVCNANCRKKAMSSACSGASKSCCCSGYSGCYKISAWDKNIFTAGAWASCKN